MNSDWSYDEDYGEELYDPEDNEETEDASEEDDAFFQMERAFARAANQERNRNAGEVCYEVMLDVKEHLLTNGCEDEALVNNAAYTAVLSNIMQHHTMTAAQTLIGAYVQLNGGRFQ